MSLNKWKQCQLFLVIVTFKNMLKGARNGKQSTSKELNGSQRGQVILDWVTNAFKMLLSKNGIKNTEASRHVNCKSTHYN